MILLVALKFQTVNLVLLIHPTTNLSVLLVLITDLLEKMVHVDAKSDFINQHQGHVPDVDQDVPFVESLEVN